MMFVNSAKRLEAASFSLISTDWLRLQVAQMPRCRNLVIFVVMTGRPITLPSRMCAR